MHQPEDLVALGDRVDHDTHGQLVVDLLEAHALALHLAVYRMNVLGPAGDFSGNVFVGEQLIEAVDHTLDGFFTQVTAHGQLTANLGEVVWFEDGKRAVFEFPFELADTEAVRQRDIDFHRLAGDALLFFGFGDVDGAHVVQAVGQFDQHNTRVIGHRDEHFAVVFGLGFFFGSDLELRQFGDAVYQGCHIGPKQAFDLLIANAGVFDDIMQQGRHDGLGVDMQFDQDGGHGNGVVDIRLARFTRLVNMGSCGHGEGLAHFFDEFFDVRVVRCNGAEARGQLVDDWRVHQFVVRDQCPARRRFALVRRWCHAIGHGGGLLSRATWFRHRQKIPLQRCRTSRHTTQGLPGQRFRWQTTPTRPH